MQLYKSKHYWNCVCNYKVAIAIISLWRQSPAEVDEDPKYIDAWGYILRLQSLVVARIEEDLKRQAGKSR